MSTATLPLTAPSTFEIFLSETRYEFLRMLRTRTYSLSVIGFPVMFYILFGLLLNRGEHIGGVAVSRYLLGGYSVFGAMGAALFGVGVGLAGDLSAGWLELKRSSPMPPLAYLLAKCCTAMAFGDILVSIRLTLGIAFGHARVSATEIASLLGLTLAFAIPFACMGLVVAMLVPMNSAPGVTNLIYLPMSFLGGLWLPIDMLPTFLKHFAPVLPTYHAGQLMFIALNAPAYGSALTHWLYLAGFSCVMLGIASLLFHRSEQKS